MIKNKAIIQVAIGIIFNPVKEILIAERPLGKSYAGYWEFPGGKAEKEETIEQTLIRELQEEVNLTPEIYEPLMVIEQPAPEQPFLYSKVKSILNVWLVYAYSGIPCANEQQALKWVKRTDLKQFAFPPANEQIIERLVLL